MPRNARCVFPDLNYHVTQRGTDRKAVFFSAGDYRTYLSLAAENVADCQVRIYAWCLMPNHVHWVLQAGQTNSLARFFRRVHGRYAQYLNARRQRIGHLWQNRFFSCPLGPCHLWRAVRYVEQNPVRANLVATPAEYAWSSAEAHRDGPGTERGALLDWEFWASAGGAKGWSEITAGPEDIKSVQHLQTCTYSGRPYGPEPFIKEMESIFGREWRPVGRPKNAQLRKPQLGTELNASFA